MNLYSYVIARDFGFAPNPFYGCCTLATCKPKIRRKASIGDWVIGTGPKPIKLDGRLIFAMRVDEKMSFNEYWEDDRFKWKKPFLKGSLKQTYGDNIYHFENEQWCQENSHHSYDDGTINYYNLNRDTQSDNVLISFNFFYFGKNSVEIPHELREKVCRNKRNHMVIKEEEIIDDFSYWLHNNFEPGLHSDPRQFISFKRYHGQ